jgi:signal transduction histidine kinase
LDETLSLEKIVGGAELEDLVSALGRLSGTAILVCGPEGRPCAGDRSLAGMQPDSFDEVPLSINGEPFGRVIVRRDSPSVRPVREKTELIAGVLAVALQGAYKSSLTARLHEEVLTESYRQVEDSNSKLVEALKEAKAASRLKSSFLATVSHELKTPLTSVLGFSEMLISGGVGELNTQQADCARAIREKGMALSEMVSGILELTRLEAGVVKLDRFRMGVAPMILDVVEAFRQKAFEKGIAIMTDVPENLPEIEYDPQKLWQVLKCLVDNAIKFSNTGGEVYVRARLDSMTSKNSPGRFGNDREEYLAISISDAGQGMEPEQGARIFETFYQVDGSHTREHGGLGMGLRLVKGYVELHGGSVEVKTAPGQGSTFTVRLPAGEEMPLLTA